MKSYITNLLSSVKRFIWQLRRPTTASNLQVLRKAGLSPLNFHIRNATIKDIPSLTALHVQTWNETYWNVKRPPTYATREYQWNEQFKITDDSWFCLLVEGPYGELVGFAKGKNIRMLIYRIMTAS